MVTWRSEHPGSVTVDGRAVSATAAGAGGSISVSVPAGKETVVTWR